MKVMTVRDPDGRPIDLAGAPVSHRRDNAAAGVAAAAFGEHTEQILRDVLGLDAARIEVLRVKKIV